jgi:hypothetical protein
MPVRAAILVAVLVAALALAVAPVASGAIDRGTILTNRGAAGVLLNMTRAQVVARLGPPISENANGFMEYGKQGANVIFDVYRKGQAGRVRMIGISGRRFCTRRSVCLFRQGATRKLRNQFGAGVRRFVDETGQPTYRVRGRYLGRPVFTDFFVDRFGPNEKIIQVFVLFDEPA